MSPEPLDCGVAPPPPPATPALPSSGASSWPRTSGRPQTCAHQLQSPVHTHSFLRGVGQLTCAFSHCTPHSSGTGHPRLPALGAGTCPCLAPLCTSSVLFVRVLDPGLSELANLTAPSDSKEVPRGPHGLARVPAIGSPLSDTENPFASDRLIAQAGEHLLFPGTAPSTRLPWPLLPPRGSAGRAGAPPGFGAVGEGWVVNK